MNSNDAINLVDQTEVPKIRAGHNHDFTSTWIVKAHNRLFCRPYSDNPDSWYTVFLEAPEGAIECGESVIPITGRIPDDLDVIGEVVNEAYLEKYASQFNSHPHIAKQMTAASRMKRTLELIPMLDKPLEHRNKKSPHH